MIQWVPCKLTPYRPLTYLHCRTEFAFKPIVESWDKCKLILRVSIKKIPCIKVLLTSHSLPRSCLMSSQRCARAYMDNSIRNESEMPINHNVHPVRCRHCRICSTSKYPAKERQVVGSCSLQYVAKCRWNWKWFAPKVALHSITPFSNES